jgi:asparagine synthase (glutamine-hydrolysing)
VCGIAGKVDFRGPVDEGLLHRMCATMEHRGPDSRGVFVRDGIGLGVQRLAIIDIEGGNQPIFNEDGTIAVVLNGEIYNFRQLRERLIRRGHRFASRSDTEILVHLYEDHGPAMVTHLRGMFAFAIWDMRKRRLFCGRDRVGKKPLFWARRGSRVWFASEIRALLEDPELDLRVDLEAIPTYLTHLYVPHPRSAFEGVQKLPPACTLVVTEGGDRIEHYWELDYSQKIADASDHELQQRLWEEIEEATRIRLMSEVPLGAFLSGGIDSSAVVAAMATQMVEPVKTFSIGFADPAFDELYYARLVAQRFGTDHHEFRVEPEALEMMPRLARQYGEPFGDPSAIPTFYLAELSSRHVTVALNGDGGDESFAGYGRYLYADTPSHLNWLPRPLRRLAPSVGRMLGDGRRPTSLRTRIQRLARLLAMTPPEIYATSLSAFDELRRRRLFTPEFATSVGGERPEDFLIVAWTRATARENVENMMATDVETYLPGDLLVKMDIATMAHSVEARSPFLDHQLMEFAASLPLTQKLKGADGKHILKQVLRSVLPGEILDRPKKGFSVPLARWFREELRDLPADVLLDRQSLDRGYFRRAEIEDLIQEHRQRIADHSLRLWVLLQLEMWHREVVDAPTRSKDVVFGKTG